MAIGQALRAMVRRVAPSAAETLFARHNHWAYGLKPGYGACELYICPTARYVQLDFMHGVGLPNPAGLIEGKGKRLRHVKVWTLEQAT